MAQRLLSRTSSFLPRAPVGLSRSSSGDIMARRLMHAQSRCRCWPNAACRHHEEGRCSYGHFQQIASGATSTTTTSTASQTSPSNMGQVLETQCRNLLSNLSKCSHDMAQAQATSQQVRASW